jgi:hypothetical protein
VNTPLNARNYALKFKAITEWHSNTEPKPAAIAMRAAISRPTAVAPDLEALLQLPAAAQGALHVGLSATGSAEAGGGIQKSELFAVGNVGCVVRCGDEVLKV